MADVFISYAKSDKPAAQQLARALSATGYSVWWDDELLCHKSYPELIREQIEQAGAVLVLWSAAAVASEWVRSEADAGRTMRKLVQASSDGRIPPMPFDQFQSASLVGWRGEQDHPGWRKLARSIVAILAGDRDPAAERAAAPPTAIQAKATPRGAWLIGGAIFVALGGALYLQFASRPSTANPPAIENGMLASQSFELLARPKGADPLDLRREPSDASERIALVAGREPFTTYRQDGEWWQVRTAAGTIGYLRRSLFRLVDEEEAAPAVANAVAPIPASSTASSEPIAKEEPSGAGSAPADRPQQPIGPACGATSGALHLQISQRLLTRGDIHCEQIEGLRAARSRLAERVNGAGGDASAIEAANYAFLDATIRNMETRGEFEVR